jgi:leucine dehydrogenase
VFLSYKDTGLKAIIGIHNSVMGLAFGGTRMYNCAPLCDVLNQLFSAFRGVT